MFSQDANITWYTEDPDLTPCFQNTVLTWIPCIFLWIWSIYQIYVSINSKTKNIPWNALNLMKVGFSSLLILIQVLEIAFLLINSRGHDLNYVYAVEYVSPGLKLISFVSFKDCII